MLVNDLLKKLNYNKNNTRYHPIIRKDLYYGIKTHLKFQFKIINLLMRLLMKLNGLHHIKE